MYLLLTVLYLLEAKKAVAQDEALDSRLIAHGKNVTFQLVALSCLPVSLPTQIRERLVSDLCHVCHDPVHLAPVLSEVHLLDDNHVVCMHY